MPRIDNIAMVNCYPRDIERLVVLVLYEKKSFNPMSNSSLDSKGLENLDWKGLFDAKTGLEHTVMILREIQGCRYRFNIFWQDEGVSLAG